MEKHEFEKLTKKQVSVEDYEKWEAAYMASDCDKYEFCKRVAPLVRSVERPYYAYIRSTCSDWRGVLSVDIASGRAVLRNVQQWYDGISDGALVFDCFDVDEGRVRIVW